MKKMYIQPTTENVEILANSIVCVSAEGGGYAPEHGIVGEAPSRGVRSILIAGPKPF